MAMVEIESEDFIKALRLLHSRAHESTDELGKLLDLYYAKQQNMDTKKPKDLLHAFSALDSLNQSLRDSEKKSKIAEDDSETDVEDNDYSGSLPTGSHFTCNICKQMDISSNNQLVECHECRLMYHQECHKPAITKKDLDPRSIWYCSKCSKKSKLGSKLVASKMTTSISAFQSMNYQSTNKGTNSIKSLESDSKLSTQSSAFKRVQGKYASYQPVSSAKPPATRPISGGAKNKSATSGSAYTQASTTALSEKRMATIKKAKVNSKHLH